MTSKRYTSVLGGASPLAVKTGSVSLGEGVCREAGNLKEVDEKNKAVTYRKWIQGCYDGAIRHETR